MSDLPLSLFSALSSFLSLERDLDLDRLSFFLLFLSLDRERDFERDRFFPFGDLDLDLWEMN